MSPSSLLVFMLIWLPLLVFGVPSSNALPPNSQTKLSVVGPSVNINPVNTSGEQPHDNVINAVYSIKTFTSKLSEHKLVTDLGNLASTASSASKNDLKIEENSTAAEDSRFPSSYFKDGQHFLSTNGVHDVDSTYHMPMSQPAPAQPVGKEPVLRPRFLGGTPANASRDTFTQPPSHFSFERPSEENFELFTGITKKTRPSFFSSVTEVGKPVANASSRKEHPVEFDNKRIIKMNHPAMVKNTDKVRKSIEFPIKNRWISKVIKEISLNAPESRILQIITSSTPENNVYSPVQQKRLYKPSDSNFNVTPNFVEMNGSYFDILPRKQVLPSLYMDAHDRMHLIDMEFRNIGEVSQSNKMSLDHKIIKIRSVRSKKMGGHTHKRDITAGTDKLLEESSFKKRRMGTKSDYSKFSSQKTMISMINDQSLNSSTGFADSVKTDSLTPGNNSNRFQPESPIKTTVKSLPVANQLPIEHANYPTIPANGRNAQHINCNRSEVRIVKSVSNETKNLHNLSNTINMDQSFESTIAISNKIDLTIKTNQPSIPFSHRLHQSFSARNSEPQTYQIDSSPFSYRAKYGLSVRTFNLPPPPPVFSHPPPDHHSSHRYPSRFGPPVSTPLPSFDTTTPTNISAQHGSNTFLLCRIRNLTNQSVSWIRSRDSHIISVDSMTFIADERFHVFHDPETGSWSLQIKFVQARDDGTYECQVSSEPKISHFVHFTVVTPVVRIPGGADIHVQLGETVTLKCVISAALHHPTYVFWYQKGERVGSGSGYGGGRRVTEERISSDTTVATLLIPQASAADAGTYTCAPDALPTASITLHVINGEHPAAMQHGTSVTSCQASRLLLLSLLTLLWLSTSSLLALDKRGRTLQRTTQVFPRVLQDEGIRVASQYQTISSRSSSLPKRHGCGCDWSTRRRHCCWQENSTIYLYVEVEFVLAIYMKDTINSRPIVREMKIRQLGLPIDDWVKDTSILGKSNEKNAALCRTCSTQSPLNYFNGRSKGNTVVQDHEARKLLEIIQPKLEQTRHQPIIITLQYFEYVNLHEINIFAYMLPFEDTSSVEASL